MQQVSRKQIQQVTSSMNKNLHVTSSMKKITFTWRKIYVQVSRREISRCSKFHEQKLACNKFREHKLACNVFREQNQFHEQKIQCTSFAEWKINMQQVSRTNKRHSTSSMSKNQQAIISMNKINFERTKINVQVSRIGKSSCNKFIEQKSARNKFNEQKSSLNRFHEQNQFYKKKSMYKFYEEKNQDSSLKKKSKIKFKNQVLRRKISMQQVPWLKISTQQVPWTISVSCGEKSMYKFYKQKNQHATSFMNKKSAWIKFHEQKSARNKFKWKKSSFVVYMIIFYWKSLCP